jgi:hypothetical protein
MIGALRNLVLLGALWAASVAAFAQLEQPDAAWNELLGKHVRWLPDQVQSRVDYAGMQRERAALKKVLDGYSALTPAQFAQLNRAQQMAFLINAYNAFTVELVLTRYPDLKSVKDLGSLFSSPWKISFFELLGQQRNLDWIEHEQLRPRYMDARAHMALNCASIGCPALRNEAFDAARLDAQLDDSVRRFLADRTRNRVQGETVQLNPIFKWYREDFERGRSRGLQGFLADYADALADSAAQRKLLRDGKPSIDWLDYDWSLNALGR